MRHRKTEKRVRGRIVVMESLPFGEFEFEVERRLAVLCHLSDLRGQRIETPCLERRDGCPFEELIIPAQRNKGRNASVGQDGKFQDDEHLPVRSFRISGNPAAQETASAGSPPIDRIADARTNSSPAPPSFTAAASGTATAMADMSDREVFRYDGLPGLHFLVDDLGGFGFLHRRNCG